MMRVLVCGGRDFDDAQAVSNALAPYRQLGLIVIQGGAGGADRLASHWASANGFRQFEYPADWKSHGRAAGPIRNQQMIDEGKPDLVVAFPGGRGTADMVRRAKAAGVRVIEVDQPSKTGAGIR